MFPTSYLHVNYCVAENFRKLVKNMIFMEKTFADCSLLLKIHQTIFVACVNIVNAWFACIFFVQYENKTFPLWPCPALGVWPVCVAQGEQNHIMA